MAITLNQHAASVTKAIIARYSDDRVPEMGLAAFFPTVTSAALELAIEVERNRQLVAVDVQRCTDPHRNEFSKATEKLFIPPFYSESFDFTKCQGYNVTFGMGQGPNKGTAQLLVNGTVKYLKAVKNKILRAIEKQRASVLLYGTVSLINGDSIDYRRKALSMVVKTSTAAWSATTTADPVADITTGVQWLRDEGLSAGSTVNAIMGAGAFGYLKANAKFIAEASIFKQIQRVDIGMPQFDGKTGMAYQGRFAAGDYIINIWTYNAVYENADTTKSQYIPTNFVVLVPDDFEGMTAYGGIPVVFEDEGQKTIQPVEADFFVYDLIDQLKKSWQFITESAPLVIPVSIDRLYTIQAY